MITLTFGVVPDMQLFQERFKAACPDGTFSVKNDKFFTGEYDICELFEMIVAACTTEVVDEEYTQEQFLDFCSCVLQSLEIEWV